MKAREPAPFRRRCGWCGRGLRWWQLNLCRRCGEAVRHDFPSPPLPQRSGWDEPPDTARGRA